MIVHENKAYQALIDEIDTLARENVFDISYSNKLKEIETLAIETKDPILQVILAYNKSNVPYENADFETAQKHIEEALRLSKEINFTYYIMRCYNSLAIIDSQQANYYASISHYLQAFQIADAHPEYKFGAILLTNIGNLFVWLKEYKSAITYLIDSYHKYYEEKLDSIYYLSIIVLNIVEAYSLIEDYEKAQEWASLDIDYIQDVKDSIAMLLALNALDVAYQNKDNLLVQQQVDTIRKHANEEGNFIYVFRVYLRVILYACAAQDKEVAYRILERAKQMAKHRSIGTFAHEFIIVQYKYYEAFQKDENNIQQIQELMRAYVDSSERTITQLQDTYNRRLVIETELLKITDEKEDAINHSKKLQKDIELDYFTQILNKVSIETYINQAILKKRKGSSQALFLIDIDHFKDVNDTYGHKRGDELILAVVEMLSSACREDMLVGRFGGDEFIIFIKGARQMKDFEDFANILLKKAQEIVITDTKRISLSIGIHVIDQATTTFKDSIQKADEALYETKRNGRNGYSLYRPK